MSNYHSFCFPSAKIPPLYLHPPCRAVLEPPKISSLIPKPTNTRITFQRIPTKQSIRSFSKASYQPIEDLPPKLQEIVRLFQAVQDQRTKRKQLLFYGKNSRPLDAQYKTGENKVKSICVAQIWVRAYFDNDKNVIFEADSDTDIYKGISALLVQGLSGRPVEDIIRVSPDFAVLIGLPQILSFSRHSGFFDTLELMKKKALHLYVESEKASNEESSGCRPDENSLISGLEMKGEDGNAKNNEELRDTNEEGSVDRKLDSCNYGGALANRGLRIKEKLMSMLNPSGLEVEDISFQHAIAGVETHFNVKVVSEAFEGKSMVKRHGMIYALLQEELLNGLQALSIVAKTPSEANASSSS